MKSFFVLAAASAALLSSADAQTRNVYVMGAFGGAFTWDTGNTARLTEEFVSGNGVTVPQGLVLPVQTVAEFETTFDPGAFGVVALGKESIYGPFRSELEFSWTKSSVDLHQDLTAAGRSLSTADAAFLTGATTPSGQTVEQVFSETNGNLSTYSLMVNFYWDIEVPAEGVHPYIGLGGGVSWVYADYAPSGLDIIDDQDTVLGYQVMFGIAADLSPRTVLHTGFRLRDTVEIDMRTEDSFFSSQVDFQVRQTILEIGLRRRF